MVLNIVNFFSTVQYQFVSAGLHLITEHFQLLNEAVYEVFSSQAFLNAFHFQESKLWGVIHLTAGKKRQKNVFFPRSDGKKLLGGSPPAYKLASAFLLYLK